MKGLSKKERRRLGRILLSAALLLLCTLLPPAGAAAPLCWLAAYLPVGWEVVRKAARNLSSGQVFDEHFLMSLATLGAFAAGEYSEAVFVMLFFQTGELFEQYALGKSRRSIAALMDIRPDTAHRELPGGETEPADPEEIAVGEIIVVKPGQRIPLDGTVVEGSSSLDTAALTGEALPRSAAPGDSVLSGCVNLTGLLRIRVTRPSEASTVSRILELVENAAEHKAVSEQFITRFARYYTPCVVFAALALALIPPLFTGDWWGWLHRGLLFLVVSCPCALVISVPLSFFGGIGAASRLGILVKGSSYLEALAKAHTLVFDKTGTLTEGVFRVETLSPAPGVTEEELLSGAALAEQASDHPIARCLREACGSLPEVSVTRVRELAGQGVAATAGRTAFLVGSRRFLEQQGIAPQDIAADPPGTFVHVAREGQYLGCISLADRIKPGAKEALAALRSAGIRRTVLLTGDSETAAEAIARELGLDAYHARLLPGDKVARLEQLLAACPAGRTLAYVGDGINDAPVLARADVGIAMGVLGSDAAIEAADIVLMDDDPRRIAAAIRVARKTVGIVGQNILLALGVKFGVLILGALGLASMWMAVFADVGVAVLAILNAMRCLRIN